MQISLHLFSLAFKITVAKAVLKRQLKGHLLLKTILKRDLGETGK